MSRDQYPPIPKALNEIHACLNAFNSILAESYVIYMSTPITSGLRHRESQDNGFGVREETRPTPMMITSQNIEYARTKAKELRSELKCTVINPADMQDIPGWTQCDYRAFWGKVICRYVSRVIAVDGWEFSRGCSYEVYVSIKHGIDVVDEEGVSLNARRALEKILVAHDPAISSEMFFQDLIADFRSLA